MQFVSHKSSSLGNLYTLESHGHTLMLEAGARIKEIRKAVSVSDLDGCLITHSHMDHAKGVRDILAMAVDCWMTLPTATTLRVSGHRLHIMQPSFKRPPAPPYTPFSVGDYWKVFAFPTEHDCDGAVAYLVDDGKDKCLFLTDSFYFVYRLPGISILAIECNWSPETLAPDLDPVVKRRLLTSHFSLENVLKFLKANDLSKCREIHLLHLSSGNSDEAMFRKTIEAATGIPVYVAGA